MAHMRAHYSRHWHHLFVAGSCVHAFISFVCLHVCVTEAGNNSNNSISKVKQEVKRYGRRTATGFILVRTFSVDPF